MLFWWFSVGLQKYQPLLRLRLIPTNRRDFACILGASVFLPTPSLIARNWRGTGVHPREDNPAVPVSLRLPIPSGISSRGLHAPGVSPPGCPGRLWSYTMNKLDTDSDMYRIVGCALAVYNHLKPGYLESVYEKALEKELTAEGFAVRRQVKLPVYYKGELLDAPFVADMVINNSHLVELKAVSNLAKIHERQVESYLKSTGMESGLLVNFGNLRRLEWRVISP